ncbi:MAG: hypothetical protein LC793_05135 [Thermomicrobia bacterium]|nr:hypothetical protein [Thermomicrobia bacterium]MCA1724696.1 hypothetical protein [Thermomicrobia bacterium]
MTTIFAEIPLPALISAASAIVLAVLGFITKIALAIFQYLTKRIEVLEGREAEKKEADQTALSRLTDSIENTGASIENIATFIVPLVDDLKYRERQRQEGRP